MQKLLLAKVALIALLSLIMLAVIGLIGGVVSERQQRQTEAVNEIAASFSGAQRTASPFLILPYVEEYEEKKYDARGNFMRSETKREDHSLVYFPAELAVAAEATTDWKHRGLFRALVYEWQANETGTFSLPAVLPYAHGHADSQLIPLTPRLVIALTDPRGLVRKPEAKWDGHALSFERGSGGGTIEGSIHADVPLAWLTTGRAAAFAMQLGLRGTESFAFVPYGDATHLTLHSKWPSPSFGGEFLPSPQATQIGKDGFTASWDVSGLASSAQADMEKCVQAPRCMGLSAEQATAVRFIEPINIYSLSNRAIKYAFLFVALIFAAFFLYELIKRLRIHPAQYLLVGLAIALFFLLLISLSEHLDFALAYGLAALASTILITSYLSGVLASFRPAAVFGGGIAILYACLYGLLSSEDNALVLGSILLFVVLAGAMLVTRKLDWYRLSDGRPLESV
jgi:inner membrane protein